MEIIIRYARLGIMIHNATVPPLAKTAVNGTEEGRGNFGEELEYLKMEVKTGEI